MSAVDRMAARGDRIAEGRARELAGRVSRDELVRLAREQVAAAEGAPSGSRAGRIAVRQAALYLRAVDLATG